ncbi:hypothetical protein KSF_038520 [Reticulibacter mediterranei]|uniref:Uncharacterized protein n=1 Tax=Reticulibacter mediterranei TaxID=2778369 RepID=A0A8J3N037_9CHLR|nr:hypothetical protein KSF_038520 [Reticulibacter mediterranei]
MSVFPNEAHLLKKQSDVPLIHISYECILKERFRDSDSYLYEIACSISSLMEAGHLSMRTTSKKTYRTSPAREISFTRAETTATTYVELSDAEQLEVRIVTPEGTYCKAFYYAHDQELIEQHGRGIISTIQRISNRSSNGQNGKNNWEA